MTMRPSKLVKTLVISLALLMTLFAAISGQIIGRGDPEIIGNISVAEVKEIKQAARNKAIEWCLLYILRGEFSAAWHFTKDLYSYRVMKIQVDTDGFVLLSTDRPHAPFNYFAGQRAGEEWVLGLNLPML